MNWKDTLTAQGFSFMKANCSCGGTLNAGEKWRKGNYTANIFTKKKVFNVKLNAQTKKTGNLTMGENEDVLLNAILGL